MKTIVRFLSLASLLVAAGAASATPAVRIPANATTAASPSSIIDTKIKIAVRNFASERGWTNVTYEYDGPTDFRVLRNGQVVAYGYYDGEVYIYE